VVSRNPSVAGEISVTQACAVCSPFLAQTMPRPWVNEGAKAANLCRVKLLLARGFPGMTKQEKKRLSSVLSLPIAD
jgi:hypothetical protein